MTTSSRMGPSRGPFCLAILSVGNGNFTAQHRLVLKDPGHNQRLS